LYISKPGNFLVSAEFSLPVLYQIPFYFMNRVRRVPMERLKSLRDVSVPPRHIMMTFRHL
jgi:hypothetical protein